ncbi:NUDIX hydrolase [Lactococcus termiticola]|uniref:ADP-ribose pyrophosphatase n=1 Tax=Lactococcus termiticola TaxID=2169526 RepID=A0A2R5HGB9_9LACT|nr:NUDIX hydrolase [Lactococcus termiticola]GBG97032.1 ADP-ribose pyrophosphatase [Lactococcus termiticola]
MYDSKKFEEKTLKRENIFEGKIFQVVRDEIAQPDGKTGFRELVFHNGGVGIVPIIDDKILLVGQYRKALERFIYEIPAGKLEPGENADPATAGLRELEEETGYSTDELVELPVFYGTAGFSSEKTYLYYSDKLSKVEKPRPKDDDEFLEVIQVSLDEAKSMLERGEIADAKTIIALQYWEIQRLKGA